MTDRGTIFHVIESLFEDWIENNKNIHPLAAENMKQLEADALAMLKEQEAVSVVQREVMHLLVWCCGSCGVPITSGDKFCRMCGKAVKWNDT